MNLKKVLAVFSVCAGFLQQPVCAQMVDSHGMLLQFNSDSTAVVLRVQNVKQCGIPSSVEWNGVNYVVSCIGPSAFYFCFSLQTVSIPNTVLKISSEAFFHCSSLQRVHVESIDPPICEDGAFSGINLRHCVLYVPKGSLHRYKKSETWRKFGKIKEYK